ncbi:Uncharacterised protein [uncultured archaeon]|nr:Uncharacterised protein [uncultured archaeon]
MAGLGVLLEVGILLGLEACSDIDQVSIEDGRSHAGADVSPFGMMPLQENHIHDLSDQGAAEVLDIHPPHAPLHLTRDVLGLFLGYPRFFVKLF